jgi:hypothetical protein
MRKNDGAVGELVGWDGCDDTLNERERGVRDDVGELESTSGEGGGISLDKVNGDGFGKEDAELRVESGSGVLTDDEDNA